MTKREIEKVPQVHDDPTPDVSEVREAHAAWAEQYGVSESRADAAFLRFVARIETEAASQALGALLAHAEREIGLAHTTARRESWNTVAQVVHDYRAGLL